MLEPCIFSVCGVETLVTDQTVYVTTHSMKLIRCHGARQGVHTISLHRRTPNCTMGALYMLVRAIQWILTGSLHMYMSLRQLQLYSEKSISWLQK